jgi:hypothetical protein
MQSIVHGPPAVPCGAAGSGIAEAGFAHTDETHPSSGGHVTVESHCAPSATSGTHSPQFTELEHRSDAH